MSLPWVKLHVSLLDNDRFQRLSSEARLTFLAAIAYAGKLGDDGALLIQGVGPAQVSDVARYTGLNNTRQLRALTDLVACELLDLDLEIGLYSVAKWGEKAGIDSSSESRRERQAKYMRDRRKANSEPNGKANSEPTSKPTVYPLDIEVDVDVDVDVDLAASQPAAQAVPNEEKAPRATTLPLDVDLLTRRRELLRTVWDLLEGEAGVKLPMSREQWGSRNGRVAMDLAKQGVPPEQVAIAWRSATTRLGSPVRMLNVVQDELVKMALPQASKPSSPSPYKPFKSENLSAEERAAGAAAFERIRAGVTPKAIPS